MLLACLSAALTGCGPDPAQLKEKPEAASVDLIDDPIPYQVDISCRAEVVSDRGATPADQLASALPGRLKLGMLISDVQSQSEWRVDEEFKLDGARWVKIRLSGTPAQQQTGMTGLMTDLDGNGTVDWIKLASGTDAGKKMLTQMAEGLSGGRFTASDRSDARHCTYDRRSTFASDTSSASDATLAEAAYCAARMDCRISDRAICEKKFPDSPILTVDEIGPFMQATLQGHGSYRPAWSAGNPAPTVGKICHSWNAQRPYL